MNNVSKKVARHKSLLIQISLICVIVYAVASSYILLVSWKWYQLIPGASLKYVSLIAFSVISFVLAICVSAYHLSTLLRRRKRRSDHARISRARFVRAKHRRSQRIL